MKQKFSKNYHNKFKEYFGINKYPSISTLSFLDKTKTYINFIKWVPGIKMIGVGNSVSMNYNTEESDIDLFIITEKNKLWFVRSLVTLIFSLLNTRKTKGKHKKRFCLSFFVCENKMNFGDFAIENDIYLYFWIIYLKPILSYDNTYDKFIKENKKWAYFGEYKNIINKNKNFIYYSNNNENSFLIKKVRKFIFYPFKKILNFFIILLDKIIKFLLIGRSKRKYKNMGKPFGIIIEDHILKFHDNDIRKKIRDTIIKK